MVCETKNYSVVTPAQKYVGRRRHCFLHRVARGFLNFIIFTAIAPTPASLILAGPVGAASTETVSMKSITFTAPRIPGKIATINMKSIRKALEPVQRKKVSKTKVASGTNASGSSTTTANTSTGNASAHTNTGVPKATTGKKPKNNPRAFGVPYQLSIPSIGLNASVTSVGLTRGGAIDVPGSVAGWWNGSAMPGRDGAAFIDGHTPGVFSSLSAVGIGSTIIVYVSGGWITYKVVAREVVPLANVNMSKALSVAGGSQGLNLMTCAGGYNASRGTYSHRLIIYAVRTN